MQLNARPRIASFLSVYVIETGFVASDDWEEAKN
jgi:hypothetical protein